MNWQQIQKQLVREATANPKKAALLGLLFVVCLYFWAPLLWGWIAADQSGGKTKVKPAGSQTLSTAAAAAAIAEPAGADAAPTTIAWRDADRALSSNALMISAELPTASRNPFRLEAELSERSTSAVVDRVGLEDLGLTLTSTFLGSHRRVALINGRAYRVGDEIRAGGYRLRIEAIGIDHAVLTLNGRRLVLRISGAALPDDQPRGDAAPQPTTASPPAAPPRESRRPRTPAVRAANHNASRRPASAMADAASRQSF